MEDKFSKRDLELSNLGMKPNFQYESYVFKDVNVGFIEVQLMSDEKWEALIEKIKPLIAERKDNDKEPVHVSSQKVQTHANTFGLDGLVHTDK